MNKLIILCFACVLASPGIAGNESGHGGGPFLLEFYHRARFVLEQFEADKLVAEPKLQIYREALKELRVDMTDDTLPSTGRVIWDPERPGKRMVLLDRKKYLQAFADRRKVDLNLFVAHEVWETKEQDINKEITQHLKFGEADFIVWYHKAFKTPPLSIGKRTDPIFFHDVDQLIVLTLDVWSGEAPEDIHTHFRDNDEVELVSEGASKKWPGAHEVVLRHRRGHGGQVGITLTNSKSSTVLYYELEFRSSILRGNGVLFETQPN